MSGQNVSIDNTSILFARGVPTNVRRSIVAQSGFRELFGLGKYLGIPLTGRSPKKADYDYLIDMVKNKLSSWVI